ncbi:MAG: Replicative DNA helicase (DnaB) [Firmicutes bacterium]|nr:Replicative DNA helicase (DnaB) [Bacillota bacterium]MDI6705010.1 replicative DNA helicase [Bacillota bacterium]
MQSLSRIPPHSIEAEQSVLGAMLLDREAIISALEFVKAEDFYKDSHREIFEAMSVLFEKGEPVDLITLSEQLKQRNKLEAVGGAAFLTDLSSSVPTIANVAHYARIIQEKSLLRRLIRACGEISEKSFEAAEEVDGIIEYAEKSIFDLSQRKVTRSFIPIKDILISSFNRIEKLYSTKATITGISTGFTDIDNKTSGMQKSDLLLVAARPSMGKTAFALNIAHNAALKSGVPVAIFSLEMSKEQLVNRMICAEANIDSHKLRTGNLEEDDWPKLALSVNKLSKANIYIDDTPGITVPEMRSKCRRLKLERGLELVVVDYLQLMQGSGRAESRQQEISDISRSLKALAREMDCPVLALSQLSRAPEMRSEHRPMLSDLRESGAIEQDADVVMFLYRDEYYHPDTEKKSIAEVIIAKQRNGPTGTVELVWMDKYTKFADMAKFREE